MTDTLVELGAPASLARRHRWLILTGSGGVLAALSYVVTVVVGGAIVPGYSHSADSVSSLTSPGAPFAGALSLGFLVYNIALVGMAVGLARSLSHARPPAFIACALLVVCGLAGLLMLWPFPQDAPGSPATAFGTVHIVLALASALTLVVATFVMAVAWRDEPTWRPLRRYSVVTGVLILITGAAGALPSQRAGPASGSSRG